jgi:hypothetical protein
LLETWEAKRLERIIYSGRTRPLVIDCWRSEAISGSEDIDSTVERNESGRCVVKGLDLPEVTNFGLFCEVFGNLLAREFGLNTPAPCLVHLSEPFVQAINPILQRNGLKLRAGIGSGCEYFSGGYSNVIPNFLSPEELEQAAAIYAYDLLVQNPDRTQTRPNCAVHSGHFKVYDFETSFSFVLMIGAQDHPWEVSKHGLGTNHLFHSTLRKHKGDVNWKPFIQSLKKIDEKVIAKMIQGLPADWCSHAPRISDHLLEAAINAQRFELELRRSLS